MSDVCLFSVSREGPQALPLPRAASTIHEIFDDLPIGVYTAFCTFDHSKFLHLEDHLDRLDRSMDMLGWEYKLDRPVLRRALHEVCMDYSQPNARIRLDILERSSAKLLTDSRLLIALSPFEQPPDSLYDHGVSVEFARTLTRQNPRIKKADFVLQRRKCFEIAPQAYECLMVNASGYILEGTTSNFYGVRDGEIWTAGEGVLEGIARKIVLNIARMLAIPIHLNPVHMDEVHDLEEAALSSSSRAIVPIVSIGSQTIGDGRPGRISRRLLDTFHHYKAREIRPAI